MNKEDENLINEVSKFIQKKRMFELILNNAPLCIKWFDASGKLISINKTGREEHHLENMSEKEVANWDYWSCIKPEYHEKIKESMKKALEKGEESSFILEHVEGTSTGRYCYSYITPVKNDKDVVELLLFVSRDITKEKELEEKEKSQFSEIQNMNKTMVDRELKMVELKQEIEKLQNQYKEIDKKV